MAKKYMVKKCMTQKYVDKDSVVEKCMPQHNAMKYCDAILLRKRRGRIR